jgi:carbonic anhydrase
MNKKVLSAGFISLSFLCLLQSALSQTAVQPAPMQLAAQAQAAASPVSQQPPAQEAWSDRMAGNRRFADGRPQARDIVDLRHGLASGQHPKAIALACSDSRVAPELLFDKSLGDLFVVRSAGNVADAIGRGSIEHAVEHLGSKLLVVLGHQKCGIVTAACTGNKMPSPNLQTIAGKIAPAVAAARTQAKDDELVNAAVRQNVLQSANDLLAGSEVLRDAVHEGKLEIVEAVYSLDTGEITTLGKISAKE